MAIPILEQGRVLIASVPSSATDRDLQQLQEDVVELIGERGSLGVILDVSGLDVLDSFSTRILGTTGDIARMRGAETVIVGIQPDVALTMVQLGVTLQSAQIGLDLEHGMRLLDDAARGEPDGE